MKKTTTKKPMQQVMIEQLAAVQLPAPIGHNSAVLEATQQVVAVIRTAVNNPKLDVRKMREIMDMQMEMMLFQAELSFNTAMNACQKEIPQIEANCKNEHTHSTYANLEAIDKQIKPIYIKHGFSITFDTRQHSATHIEAIATVRHIDGHKETYRLVGELDGGGFKGTANKTGIQAAGSSASYLQRYLTKLIFNVVIIGEDKDGNRAKADKPAHDEFSARVNADAAAGADEKSVKMFKRELETLVTKEQRVKHINDNIFIIHALAKEGKEDVIQELHALADKGK